MPFLAGQRLLKLLCTAFTDLSHYHSWKKISAGAYGVIYGCETALESPREVAIKEMSFPKSIYERSVLHDIFTEITCLEAEVSSWIAFLAEYVALLTGHTIYRLA